MMTGSRMRLSVAVAALLLALPAPAQAAGEIRYASLTILHTNDLHGHLFPFDYDAFGVEETDVGGAARRATIIRQLKSAANGPVLVMDAGDAFMRGPLDDLHGVPDFDVMNAVPYDVMTLGNNEFKGAPGEQGLKILLDRIRQARFAVLSANVLDKSTRKKIVAPSKVFDLKGLRVGVLGLTAPRVASYEQAKTLEVRDPVIAAKQAVAGMRSECDFIVALTHIGYPRDLELAALVPEIDVVIGGDSHTWTFQPTLVRTADDRAPAWWIGGTLVCQAGEWGRSLGKLELNLRRDDLGRFRVAAFRGELVEVNASAVPAPDVERIIERYARPFRRVLGNIPASVPKSQAPDWVAARIREAAGADVGAVPLRAVENGLKAGAVTELDVRSMFPWVNPVVRLTVTGKQLREFASELAVALAGARLVDGIIYVGKRRLADWETCTLAVEEFYADTSAALSSAPRAAIGMTTRDVVTRYLSVRRASIERLGCPLGG